jgi:hypothetical protein
MRRISKPVVVVHFIFCKRLCCIDRGVVLSPCSQIEVIVKHVHARDDIRNADCVLREIHSCFFVLLHELRVNVNDTITQ